MTPGRASRLVARWVRLYTRGLPASVAERRIEEIRADLHDHIAHERSQGTGDRRLALGLLSRMLRGAAADAAWRAHRLRAATAYRSGMALAIFSPLFLIWLIGALGLIGVDGDRADLMYAAVLAVGIVGSIVARFRPAGMARVLGAMALVQTAVAAIAIVAGKHESPVTSAFELLGLNAMFVALFLTASRLFRHASR
jgi:hypothetical protein